MNRLYKWYQWGANYILFFLAIIFIVNVVNNVHGNHIQGLLKWNHLYKKAAHYFVIIEIFTLKTAFLLLPVDQQFHQYLH